MSENNGWIKCEDRLPNECDTVLLYLNDDEYPYIVTGWLDTDREFSDGKNCLSDYVTHWQPLPQPPEEQIMPNWCVGDLKIRGETNDITRFLTECIEFENYIWECPMPYLGG